MTEQAARLAYMEAQANQRRDKIKRVYERYQAKQAAQLIQQDQQAQETSRAQETEAKKCVLNLRALCSSRTGGQE